MTRAKHPLIGKRVKIGPLHAEDRTVLERTVCFVGEVGTVTDGPDLSGSFWVEFPKKCEAHGDSGAIYSPSEFQAV